VNRLKNTWYAMLLVTWSVSQFGCANADDAAKAADQKAATPEPAARAQVDNTAAEPAPATAADTQVPDATRPGEDWPKFLGPRDDGTSSETGLLAKWPEKGPPVVWEKSVGTGYSAPSVRGNRLVIHHRVRNEEIVDCLAADTGKPVWSHAYESNFSDPYGYNNGPRCSPLLTADRCYTFGAEGKLLCLNLQTGKQIWLRDTAADWKIPDAFFGVGSTPILHGKLLIVMVGGEPNAGVVAFDADTGKTVWQNVNKETWKSPDGSQLDDKLASYSSLIEARINGHDHVFSLMRDGLVSLNPTDGQVRFSYFFRSDSFESVNAARPVIIGDEVLLSAAYKAGAALLKIKPDGKGFVEIWKSRNLQTHWSTTIHHAGYLYGFSGRHEGEARFRCIDLKTGDIVWETDGLPPNIPDDPNDVEASSSRYYGRGSAIMAEGKFIVLGERGLLALVEVNPKEFKEISRVKFPAMKYPSWAAPVLSRKRLYLRCEDHMMCLDLAAQK
jgi:outer membrane protein assembly factor BamB